MYGKKTIKISFLNSFGTLAYVGAVSWFIANGDRIFGKMSGYLAPVAFLLLFVISAAITGILVLGKPAILFYEGNKKEAIRLLLLTLSWLVFYLGIIFIYLIIGK